VSIDDDDYFALMMNNSWNLRGDASPYKKYEKGWANEEATNSTNTRPKVEFKTAPQKVQRSGQMSNGNPLSTTAAYYNESTSAARGRGATGSKMFEGPNPQREAKQE